MTKSELRRARKEARLAGRPLAGELALHADDRARDGQPQYSETPRGRRALDRWARQYDALNGAPEGYWDR